MTFSELKEQLRQRDLQLEKQAAQIKEQAARIKELERKNEELKNLAFLVYWTGMSIDKARGVLAFFTGLQLVRGNKEDGGNREHSSLLSLLPSVQIVLHMPLA